MLNIIYIINELVIYKRPHFLKMTAYINHEGKKASVMYTVEP